MKNDSKKRKKQFYNNKNRNARWTEEPKGREIDFADKYIYDGGYSDKYDETKRKAHENRIRKKKKQQKIAKRVLVALLCVCLISVGYTGMDVYITRHAVPVERLGLDDEQNSIFSEIQLDLKAKNVDSISLDGSIMLKSIIDDAQSNGYNSIVFDAKREDGTIGYKSNLASIDAYGAMSNPASSPKASISKLIDNDVLPVARICCYRDNVIPALNPDMALKQGDKFFTYDNSTYLNPNSDDTYSYIRDVMKELNAYGVSVFVLTGYDLPDDISDKFDDGFDAISKKLAEDLGNEVKILKEIDVSINGTDFDSGKVTNSAIRKEIQAFDKLGDDQIYYISTKLDNLRVSQQLADSNISNYIIGD